jgi:hypothetical protein
VTLAPHRQLLELAPPPRPSLAALPRRARTLVVLQRPTHTALVCVLALAVLGSLAAPQPAAAFSVNPADWAVDGFKAIIKWIFGDVSTLAEHLVQFLLGIPLLADPGQFPGLNQYRDYVVAGAWGILGLSFVVSSLRYWLSSYSGSGAWEALMGFARTAGAIVALLLFPRMFDQLIRLVNEFTAALIGNPIVSGSLGQSITTTLSAALTPDGGIAMLVGIASLVIAIILVVVKVIVTTLLAVLFVLFALAVAVWPIEELSWAFRNAIQAILALLMFPVIWAVCFGTFAVLSADTLFGSGGSLVNSILGPLFTLAALIVAFHLPFVVLRQATNAGLAPSATKGLQTAYYARAMLR